MVILYPVSRTKDDKAEPKPPTQKVTGEGKYLKMDDEVIIAKLPEI